MVNFYVRRIRAGKMTLEEVPMYWRSDVGSFKCMII